MTIHHKISITLSYYFLIITAFLLLVTRATSQNNYNNIVEQNNSQQHTNRRIRSRQIQQQQESNKNEDNQQHGIVYCRITLVGTMKYTTNDDDNTTTTTTTNNRSEIRHHQPSCIPIVHWKETDDIFPINLPEHIMNEQYDKIKSGTLLISISNSTLVLVPNKPKKRIISELSSDYQVLVTDDVPNHYVRELQATSLEWKSTMTVALVRISTLDSTPYDNGTTLINTYYGPNGFQNQYDQCSFGKLHWIPSPDVPGGIIEVKVNKPVSDYAADPIGLIEEAQNTMMMNMNIPSITDIADKIIMCLPPGTGDWAASAGVKHWRVQMNNEWCGSLSGTVHELAHTLGVLHAHADGIVYNDRTVYMGSGYTDKATPRKCFDGYTSYLFGWYSSRHIYVDFITPPPPSSSEQQQGQLIHLATFVDYDKTSINQPVNININNQYYLQYNRMKSFNNETEQKQDQITITKPVVDGTDSVGGLSPGNQYVIPNYNSIYGNSLIIEACEALLTEEGVDIMIVSIAINKSLCGTNTEPSKSIQNIGPAQQATQMMNWLSSILGSSSSNNNDNQP